MLPSEDTISKLKTIQSVFGLRDYMLARILGISRVELYFSLRDGKLGSTGVLNKLFDTALIVKESVQLDISKHLRNVLVERKTLLQWFNDPWSKDSILNICNLIQQKVYSAELLVPSNDCSVLVNQGNLHRHVRLD